jgi:hypothetical protein
MIKITSLLFSFVLITAISCSKTRSMSPEDFINIQTEYFAGDQTEESKETIAKKYGYSAKQYNDFEEKVESDSDLKTEVGKIRLKNQD